MLLVALKKYKGEWVLLIAPCFKMGDIKAGVVLKSRFITPENKGKNSGVFKSYIDYIDRESAVRNKYIEKYSLYNDYMDDVRKTSELFTEKSDSLTQEEKKKLKEVFNIAQENKSIMWQHVISFDNRWLRQQGILGEGDVLNENKLKDVTRTAMMKLKEKEHMQNAIWSAAIHYNTDNIHIHIAMVEPFPMRELKGDEIRGKLKNKSLLAAKGAVVSSIVNSQFENKLINDIIRNNIVADKKRHVTEKNEEFMKLFMDIHRQLPEDKRLWNYGCNGIKHLRPLLDKMTDIYLNEYHSEDMEKLNELFKIQDEKYRTAYGKGKTDKFYSEGKKKDLYYRMGNAILKNIKIFDKEEKEAIYERAKEKEQKLYQKDLNIYKGKNLRYNESKYALNVAIQLTQIFMKDEMEKIKNQVYYENMREEIKYKNLKDRDRDNQK